MLVQVKAMFLMHIYNEIVVLHFVRIIIVYRHTFPASSLTHVLIIVYVYNVRLYLGVRGLGLRSKADCSLPTGSARRAALPVFRLLTGRFWGFSPRRGDTLHRSRSNLAGRSGPIGTIAAPFFRRSAPPCQI